MLKLTKLKKLSLDIQRRLFFPKGTVLELIRFRANKGYDPVETLKDGWLVQQSDNLESEFHIDKRLGVPTFQIVEITDTPRISELFIIGPKPTDVRWDVRIVQIQAVEPPVGEPRFWRLRLSPTGEGSQAGTGT